MEEMVRSSTGIFKIGERWLTMWGEASFRDMTTYRGGKTGAVKSAGGSLNEPLSYAAARFMALTF